MTPQLLAHRFTQLARATTSAGENTSAAQLTRAAILLDRALELDASESETWLLRAEAAQMQGDSNRVLECLKGYLKLRPADDVAQLRMIELLAARQQTVEKRVGFYQRIFEGASARRFTPALRSRVAYRAALLAAEQGQAEEYARLLAMALSLDSTNKAAAAESYRVLASNPNTTVQELAAALFTTFQADPTDPSTHAAIGDMLMANGQYDKAAQWYYTSNTLDRARFGGSDPDVAHRWAMALWASGQTSDSLGLLNNMIMPGLDQALKQASGEDTQAVQEANQAIDAAVKNASGRTLLLRSVILAMGSDPEKLTQSLSWLGTNAAAQPSAAADAGVMWAMLLADRNINQVPAMIESVAKQLGNDDATVKLAGGWLAIRQDRLDEAIAMLKPLAEKKDPRALLGLGIVHKLKGDQQSANQLWAQAQHTAPDDVFGLLAMVNLRENQGKISPIQGGAQLAALFTEIPEDLRLLGADPLSVLQIRAVVEPNVFSNGEPAYITIEYHNVSNYTLALGPDGTLPTQALVDAKVRLNGRVGPAVRPDVVNLHRRLRLEPRKSFQVKIRVDYGQLGLVLATAPSARARADLTVILNPRVKPGGGFTAGFLGSMAQVRNVTRLGTSINVDGLVRLESDTASPAPIVSMRAASALIPVAQQLAAQDESGEMEKIIERLAKVYKDKPAQQQAWQISYVSPVAGLVSAAEPIIDLAAASEDPDVALALLATQVVYPESALLNPALRGNLGPTLQTFAEVTKTMLEEQRDEKPDDKPDTQAP